MVMTNEEKLKLADTVTEYGQLREKEAKLAKAVERTGKELCDLGYALQHQTERAEVRVEGNTVYTGVGTGKVKRYPVESLEVKNIAALLQDLDETRHRLQQLEPSMKQLGLST